ncbi:hypothetical protein IGI04_002757, partial [Brassica rapa subsp. trilocularis]
WKKSRKETRIVLVILKTYLGKFQGKAICCAIKDAKQWQETQTPKIVMARQLDDQQPPLPTMITIHTDAAWSENSLFAGFEIIIFDAAGGIVERKRIGRFCGISPC